MYKKLIAIVALSFFLLGGCGGGKEKPKVFTGMPDLVLTQAQFHDVKGADGKVKSVPGAAKMVLVYKTDSGWDYEVVEDSQSNVFHKAIPYNTPAGETGLLTIAANEAMLKYWTRQNGKWVGKLLFKTEFGGKQNRLRDFEIGDVTGDGKDNIVIATHDQGVVMVLTEKNGEWDARQIDYKPNTFVHEIELGDIDGDGVMEIFATPSNPNKLDGTVQPGMIKMYKYDGKNFNKTIVEKFPARHVKEILCADVDGDGRPELYGSVEAEMSKVASGKKAEVTIKQYQFNKGKITSKVVMTLPDMLCRFLCAGDVDGDGKSDIVVSPLKSGVWVLHYNDGKWSKELIDDKSSGFEHATLITDLDGDGRNEIYVAADDQGVLNRLTYDGSKFVKDNLISIPSGVITFGVMPGKLAAYQYTEKIRLGK